MPDAAADTAPREPELGLTMTHILRHPLSALRASMESLAADFREEDPRGETLRGALEQVTRMARDVQALVDWTAPRAPSPLTCSVDEILHAALRACTYRQVSRLSIARGSAPFDLHVDGPLLSNALSHLLQAAFSAGGDAILLQARCEGSHAVFAIVQECQRSFCAMGGEGAKDAAAQLGVSLARRDIERMGGTLAIERTPRGCTCALVRIPVSQGEGTDLHREATRRQSLR